MNQNWLDLLPTNKDFGYQTTPQDSLRKSKEFLTKTTDRLANSSLPQKKTIRRDERGIDQRKGLLQQWSDNEEFYQSLVWCCTR